MVLNLECTVLSVHGVRVYCVKCIVLDYLSVVLKANGVRLRVHGVKGVCC